MIALTKIRDLDLSEPASPGRPLHLAAASGLVWLNSFIYVIADDELHLGVFQAGVNEPGHLIRLFDGALPDLKPERKKQKPDLEALAMLPSHGNYPHGALLALGSGSTQNRRLGALIALDTGGAICGVPRVVDLSPMYVPLGGEFAAPNIEGAAVSGNELALFQRGNKRHPDNAVIRFPLAAVLDALGSGRVSAFKPSAINRFDLGQIDGIPLCFTDATALADGCMVFTAIAEDTGDAYNDGPCLGAAIGIVGDNGHLRCLQPLMRPYKIEGVDGRPAGKFLDLLLVTDADDADIPAGLFSARIAI